MKHSKITTTLLLGAALLTTPLFSADLGIEAASADSHSDTRRVKKGKRLKFPLNTRTLFNSRSCDRVFDTGSYKACYDYSNKTSSLVRYRLDGDKVGAVNIKKRPWFYEEKSLPRNARAYYKDYGKKRGFDRAHLASDASFDWSQKSLNDTYNMINIVPQYSLVNRKTWIKAEKYSRYIAKKLGYVDVLNVVVTPNKPHRIGYNKVAVPEGFYKIIYNEERGFRRCFYYRNEISPDIQRDKLRNHLVDCEQIYLEGSSYRKSYEKGVKVYEYSY